MILHTYFCDVCVSDSPRWQEYALKKFAAREHESVTLECRVLAEPAPKFFWQMRGGNITSSSAHQISTTDWVSKMTVPSVRTSDYGIYTCVAVNLISQTSFQLQLLTPGGAAQIIDMVEPDNALCRLCVAVV